MVFTQEGLRVAEVKKVPVSNNNSFLLISLGCLVGFLAGFVLLLANLPNYDNLSTYEAKSGNFSNSTGYEFYSVLPGLSVDKTERSDDAYDPQLPKFRSRMGAKLPQPLENSNGRLLEIPASYSRDAYYLQAGSFRSQPDAEKMRAKLLLNGLDAFVKPGQAKGQTLHRVRVGPFYEKGQLDRARSSLKKRGISYMVLRVRG